MKKEFATYDVYYDEEGDFLEISFGEPATEGTTDEVEQGVFITRDIATKEIKNIGILDFRKRVQLFKKILARYSIQFPLDINISS